MNNIIVTKVYLNNIALNPLTNFENYHIISYHIMIYMIIIATMVS